MRAAEVVAGGGIAGASLAYALPAAAKSEPGRRNESPAATSAVVIGASMAGLAAAAVLAPRVHHVTVLDRDRLSEGPQPRKCVPQARHAHGLLRAGELVLRDIVPGLMEDLVEAGAQTRLFSADGRWWQSGGYRSVRSEDDFVATLFTRPLLEDLVRRRVEALPNVEILPGAVVRGLRGDARRVRGVDVEMLGERRPCDADLVVDASGRGSQAPDWLEALGAAVPEVQRVKIDMGYASRLLRRSPTDPHAGSYIVTTHHPPHGKRGGVLFPVEGDRWIVTLYGMHGDHPPTDDVGFLAFAESLAVPDIAEVLAVAAPLSPIVTHRLPSNQWRRYDRCRQQPAGFVALGDSVCSFNPIYGQGMSSALLQAVTLGALVDAHGVRSERLPKRFHRRARRVIMNPWQIAACADFALPETTGPRPPMLGPVNRYLERVFLAAQHDPVVADAAITVMHLLAPPPLLMRPSMVRRVRRAARLGPVTTLPRSSSSRDRTSATNAR